jgi:hypothetical protein
MGDQNGIGVPVARLLGIPAPPDGSAAQAVIRAVRALEPKPLEIASPWSGAELKLGGNADAHGRHRPT